jgi:hypothetical protein
MSKRMMDQFKQTFNKPQDQQKSRAPKQKSKPAKAVKPTRRR